MEAIREITIEIPADVLEKAQKSTGSGITQTVRAGLQLLAASQAYADLRSLRGKVKFSRTLAELKADRRSPRIPAHGSAICRVIPARMWKYSIRLSRMAS